MKKNILAILFGLLISSTVFAMSPRPGGNHGNGPRPHPGGSGVPEPASILLIIAGGAAAYGIKKAIHK